MKIKSLSIILLLLTISFLNGFSQNEIPNFAFIKKIALSGSPRWDYLTMDENRLFVSNFDRVHVVDLKTDMLITTISDLKGVHGITLAKDLLKGYISNGTDSTVTVFDYNTLKVLKTIQITGKKADAILYDKFSKKVFVYCNGSNHTVAIDAKTDEVIKNITIGDAPEFAVVNGIGSIFNNLEDSNEIVEIDTKTLTVKNTYSLKPNETPTGLAIDVRHNRLFSVCRKSKTLVVMNASNGQIVSTLPIGEGVDGVTFDVEKKLIVASNGGGTATVIHQDSADKYTVVQTLTTERRQRTITHNNTTHNIYMSGASYEADGKTAVPNSFGVYVYGLK
jgi:YVTN family beta-propeller protein